MDIPRSAIEDLIAHQPRIMQALWWATLVDEGTLRAWLVNMGQREADRQMAHLICELFVRLGVVGLVSDNSFEIPITQGDLADTLGITSVACEPGPSGAAKPGTSRVEEEAPAHPRRGAADGFCRVRSELPAPERRKDDERLGPNSV